MPNEQYSANQSLHPGLPSVESAHADHSQLYSDHTPVLVTVPNPQSEDEPFQIVTWNVMEVDHCNGFSKNDSLTFGENEEQNSQRCVRIAEALVRFINEHNPDFITLQEVQSESKIYQAMLNISPDISATYGQFIHLDGDMLTLYRNDRVELAPKAGDGVENSIEIKGIPALFQLKSDLRYRIKLTNTHHAHGEDTRMHENSIENFLMGNDSTKVLHSDQHHTISIITGDFNGSMASLNQGRYNAVTSVVPSAFLADPQKFPYASENRQNGQNHQGAIHIDGGFYSDQSLGMLLADVRSNQAASVTLNPVTGKPYTQDELRPFNTRTLNRFQADQVSRYRMSITLGQHFRDMQWLTTHETIESLQNRLIAETGNGQLCVRLMANLNNDQTLGFIVDENVYQFIKGYMNSQLATQTCGRKQCIYVTAEQIEDLINHIKIAHSLISLKSLFDQNADLFSEIGTVYNCAFNAAQDPASNKQDLAEHLSIIVNAAKSPGNLTVINELMRDSKRAEGAPNRKLQALGVAMGILGVALCVLGALVLATCLIPLPHMIPAAVAGSVLIASGVGLFAAGGAMVYRNRRTGFSDAMVELAEASSAHKPVSGSR